MLTLINGNKQAYDVALPEIKILGFINDVALEHIKENTGLTFTSGWRGEEVYTAQPTDAEQIVKLFLTYNFKTQYYNNADVKNTIFLKCDHHTGFKVDSICYDCVQHNHIHLSGLQPGDRLAC